MLSAMLDNETQISTIWLQCILLFSIIWGFSSNLVSDSKKSFDVYFRKLLSGIDDDIEKPKGFKLSKQQMIPDRGTIYEWVYDKKNNGTWISWSETAPTVKIYIVINKFLKNIN